MPKYWKNAAWWIGVLALLLAIAFYIPTQAWEFDRKIYPIFAAAFVFVFAAAHTIIGIFRKVEINVEPIKTSDGGSLLKARIKLFVLIGLFLLGTVLLGHRIGIPLGVALLMLGSGERLLPSLLGAAIMWGFVYLVLEKTIHILFPTPLLAPWLGY